MQSETEIQLDWPFKKKIVLKINPNHQVQPIKSETAQFAGWFNFGCTLILFFLEFEP